MRCPLPLPSLPSTLLPPCPHSSHLSPSPSAPSPSPLHSCPPTPSSPHCSPRHRHTSAGRGPLGANRHVCTHPRKAAARRAARAGPARGGAERQGSLLEDGGDEVLVVDVAVLVDVPARHQRDQLVLVQVEVELAHHVHQVVQRHLACRPPTRQPPTLSASHTPHLCTDACGA
eukprot:3463321-Rhodomonas_salina.1